MLVLPQMIPVSMNHVAHSLTKTRKKRTLVVKDLGAHDNHVVRGSTKSVVCSCWLQSTCDFQKLSSILN